MGRVDIIMLRAKGDGLSPTAIEMVVIIKLPIILTKHFEYAYDNNTSEPARQKYWGDD
jgi:hypothetical protein